jgi:tetratricopeptide (TPR) repeat protein
MPTMKSQASRRFGISLGVGTQLGPLRAEPAWPGAGHPDTLISKNNLGLNYRLAGSVAEAIDLHAKTLALQSVKLEPDHTHTLVTMNNLASDYRAAGRLDDAVALFEKTIALRKTKLSPEHPHTIITLLALAETYLAARRWAGAEATSRANLAVLAKARPDRWERFSAISLLGASFTGQGRFAEAEPLVRAGYHGINARRAKVPVRAKNAIAGVEDRVVPFYEAWHRPQEAADWQARLGLRLPNLPTNAFAGP